MLKATQSAISRIVIFDPRFPSMYSSARLACQDARPPVRKMLCDGGALVPIASDSLPGSVDASLRHRQATSRFDSNNVIARITRCLTRAEAGATELGEGFGRDRMIGPCALSIRMFITGNIERKAFSSLISIVLPL